MNQTRLVETVLTKERTITLCGYKKFNFCSMCKIWVQKILRFCPDCGRRVRVGPRSRKDGGIKN